MLVRSSARAPVSKPVIPAQAGIQFLRKMPAQPNTNTFYEENSMPALAGMNGVFVARCDRSDAGHGASRK
jgi:hypothetical protein